jgi:hypothetical protein
MNIGSAQDQLLAGQRAYYSALAPDPLPAISVTIAPVTPRAMPSPPCYQRHDRARHPARDARLTRPRQDTIATGHTSTAASKMTSTDCSGGWPKVGHLYRT